MAVCRETSCQRQHLEFLRIDSKACPRLWLETSKPASIVTLPPTRPQLLTVPLHLGVTFFQTTTTCGPFSKNLLEGEEIVFLCSPSCSRTHSVDYAGFELKRSSCHCLLTAHATAACLYLYGTPCVQSLKPGSRNPLLCTTLNIYLKDSASLSDTKQVFNFTS